MSTTGHDILGAAPEDAKVEISTRSWYFWYRVKSSPRRLIWYLRFHIHHLKNYNLADALVRWRDYVATRRWISETRRTAVYKHSPLEPDSIRIFRLFPGHGHDILKGEIYQRKLNDDTKEYTAISYAWGDPTPRHPLIIDGQKFLMAENLKNCLLSLRSKQQTISLWIDALCINQDTDSAGLRERAQQISIMNQIFAKCRHTIINLGRVSGPPKRLGRILEDYAIRGDELKIPTASDNNPLVPFSTSAKDRPDLYDQDFWLMFADLLELPYFHRMWCLQEYVFAKKPLFILNGTLTDVDMVKGIKIASRQISWAWKLYRYTTPSSIGKRVQSVLTESNKLYASVKLREDARNGYQQHTPQTLCNILVFSQSHQVTDPRDRIYALHGLLPDPIRQELIVDYEESAEALEERVTRLFIQHGYGVFVLLHASGISRGAKSWVIPLCSQRCASDYTALSDFTLGIGAVPDNIHSFEPIPITYRACGLTQGSVKFSPTPNNLLASGCVHDTITAISPEPGVQPEENFKDPMKFLVYFWCRTAFRWFQDVFPKADQDDRLWRTLILERTNNYGVFSTLGIEDKELVEKYQAGYVALQWHFEHMKDKQIEQFEDMAGGVIMPILHRALAYMRGRKLARTRRGYLAAVPEATEVGDEVAIFTGVPAPLLLRRTSEAYSLVGPCFVHGLMRGEVLKDPGWRVEDIEIGFKEKQPLIVARL